MVERTQFPSILGEYWRKSVLTIVLVVVSCWIALVVLKGTPYGKYLSHQSLEYASLANLPFLTLAFSGGWLLMIGAMMFPILAPVLVEFDKVTSEGRKDRAKIFYFVGGFTAIWLLVGIALFFSDFWVHKSVNENAFLSQNSFLIPVSTLIFCGLFQFTNFKRKMLFKCRPSSSSVRADCMLKCSTEIESFKFGINHGFVSIGACGTFMLLMFATDLGTIWSMLLFGAMMIAERYAPHFEKLASRFGLAMFASAVVYVLFALGF